MPYYNYTCEDCGLDVSLYVSVEDIESGKDQLCERCGNLMVRVLFNRSVRLGDTPNIQGADEDDNSYGAVKKRLSKEIEQKRKELNEYKKETKEFMDGLGDSRR